MSATDPGCRAIEADLMALAAGEATPVGAEAVERHVAGCAECRADLARYREVEGLLADLKDTPLPGVDATVARAELESHLADLRRRFITYGVFASPLGPILIARTVEGVAAIEYLDASADASRLVRRAGADAQEDGAATEDLYRDVLDYLAGRRSRFEWPLDLRGIRSDFQRRVLEATARLPYGAVTSYSHIADEIGMPTASRAVAQALRHNPVPLVIPCHRVIGSSGALTGYAGNKVGLKQRLLAIEGVPVGADRSLHVERDRMYQLMRNEVEYCLPTCGSIGAEPLTRITLFGSREGAESAGFRPCSSCRPDLHPLSTS